VGSFEIAAEVVALIVLRLGKGTHWLYLQLAAMSGDKVRGGGERGDPLMYFQEMSMRDREYFRNVVYKL
jgi:hypothetical protein